MRETAAPGEPAARARRWGLLKYWGPLLLWLVAIVSFSGDAMSAGRTSRFVEPAIRWLLPDASPETVYVLHVLVRKCAHLAEYVNVTARNVSYDDAAEIARKVIDLYTDEELGLDGVFLIYNEFRSAISQTLITKQLLPIGGLSREEPAGDETAIDYIYEQPPDRILGRLLPKYIETQIYYSLLESVASEHGARMTAMDSASKNASELIDGLTLYANRVRQAAITNEIIEVVSGAQSLEG